MDGAPSRRTPRFDSAVMMALEADVKEHYQAWIPKFEVLAAHEEEESVNLQFYYALLVLQGDIYTASFRDGHLILDEAQHVQLIRDHFSSNRQNSYQIDVVKESFLRDYLDLIDREMKSIGLRLQRNRRKVADSMKLLMRRSTAGFDVDAPVPAGRLLRIEPSAPARPRSTACPGNLT